MQRHVLVADSMSSTSLTSATVTLQCVQTQSCTLSCGDGVPNQQLCYLPAALPRVSVCMQEDFWSNILRYVSYFFSVLLGTAYTAIKPIGGFLRKPVSAVITVAVIIGLYIFVSSTVNAMLGVNQDNALVLPPLNGGS